MTGGQIEWDRGQPLTPEQVALRVERRVRAERAVAGSLSGHTVVVHPAVYEDIYVDFVPSLWPTAGVREAWRSLYAEDHSPHEGRAMTTLRCCGLLMDTDPSLRLDEVRLRRDEVLT